MANPTEASLVTQTEVVELTTTVEITVEKSNDLSVEKKKKKVKGI